MKFIHRVPLSAGTGSGGSTDPVVERMTRETLDTLSSGVIGPINIELKFNWSHAYSSTDLVKVHGGRLTDAYWNPPPENYRLAWMMRNEDFFALRWGQPDFIREHLAKNDFPGVNGYFVGSECYIPAKDYITSLPGASYEYAFERQWMYYQQWGRLLYDPTTPDGFFAAAFDRRFPGHGNTLFAAQQRVSRVPLFIASFMNATWDYTLYSEGMLTLMGNDEMKLISLPQLCDRNPLDPDYVGVKAFLDPDRTPQPGELTPPALADSLEMLCTAALQLVEPVSPDNNTDLLYEVSDIRAWAHLGLYFAYKLRAATAYQQYRNTEATAALEEAIAQLETATEHWRQLVAVTTPVYEPMPLQHYERNDHQLFHWSVVGEEVEGELEWVRSE